MATVRKRGKKFYFRGPIPSRQEDGTIRRVRHEEVLQASSRARADKEADDLARYYWDLAYGPPPKRPSVTFAKAALVYIDTKGKSDRFIDKLVEHFGDTPLDEIDQQKATEAASKLYPGWRASSLNRAIYTPLSAIGVRGLVRPQSRSAPVNVPDEKWFDAVLPACPPRLGALLIFLTLTGRRVGEAIALTEKDVDGDGCAHIGRTKTGVSVTVALPALCCDLLSRDKSGSSIPGPKSERLFGYATVAGAHRALKRVCDKAGVIKYGFHALGRHSAATRWLKAGKSLKFVQTAGGWESMSSMARYLHLEQSEVARDVQEMGEEWGKTRKLGDK